jgi:SAM-dependent methyltransferase
MKARDSNSSRTQLLKKMQREGWGRINQQRLRFITRYAGQTILDVGCARGDYVNFLNKRGHQTFGVDLLTQPEWQHIRPANFIQGDALSLPFSNQSFDTLLAFEILEHIPKPDLALQEFFRVIRENLIISVPNCDMNEDLLRSGLVYSHWLDQSHCNFFDEDTLRNILERNGFNVQVLTDINQILPDFIPLRSWHFPYNLAFQLSRLLSRIPLRKQYRMTLLAVTSRKIL